uniref:Uncharacterized protein n=1 Tax=Arundo donax TaxID=35708 RepID=A0A0A9DA49_ARUDO
MDYAEGTRTDCISYDLSSSFSGIQHPGLAKRPIQP